MTRILIVEDNRAFAAMLASNLRLEGYEVQTASTGAEGITVAQASPADLVLLDLMLPAVNGFSVLQRVRDAGISSPVMVISALGTEHEKVRAFSLGADDYLVKPFGLRELLARVRALLRRVPGAGASPSRVHIVGDLAIDFAKRTVHRGDQELLLRPKEFDLFAALVRHRGEVVSRADLLREVWGYAEGTQSRTVESHLAALRERLGDSPGGSRYILTIRGVGYRIVPSP